MTTLTIRDLRQRWPEAERTLQTEEEIVITRDGKPVAKLVRFQEPQKKRPRFDAKKHMAEMLKTSGGKLLPDSTPSFVADRADRL
jgi:antitoxin (DNA-binding transcriptional repressor) of toxin-antitoxin stability system